jgi:DNA-directed RNA polymerase subunit F
MVRKIQEEKPIPLGQVYELLQQREEAGINYVQRVTAQHAENLSRHAAYSEEVLEMIQNDFGLSRLLAVQVVNMNPKKLLDIKAVTGDKLTDDQIEKLLEKYTGFVLALKTATTEATSEDEEESSDIQETFEEL